MPEAKIDTGIDVLDADLKILFESSTGKRRQEIKAAIANSSLSREDFFKVVPSAIYRLAIVVRKPSSYQHLVETVRKGALPELERARGIVEQHFIDILKHPAVLPHMTPKEGGEETTAQFESLNVVTGISHIPYWTGSPPKLCPGARLAFLSMDERMLLDTTFDWEDSLFVVESLLEILGDDMEAGKGMAGNQMVDLPYKEQMEQRLSRLEQQLGRIKELGPLYGLRTATIDEPVKAGSGKPK